MHIEIALIAAVAENGVIGSGQIIPWRIPSDFAWFKRTTMGKPVIMGRKQFETVGKPLPGRTNIIATRQKNYQPQGVMVVNTLEQALHEARVVADADGVDEIMVIGGGEIYAQVMPQADRLYVSHVNLAPTGDVLFPIIDPLIWAVMAEPVVVPYPGDSATYRIRVYKRRKERSALIA